MKLNLTTLQKWTAGLDSDKFQQTRNGSLQDEDGYCCLGVACVLFIPKKHLRIRDKGWLKGGYPGDFQSFAPDWLKDVNNDFKKRTTTGLDTLNDEGGFTFSEIATVLELVYIHKILD